MARIDYNDETAAAFQAAREVPRSGLADWRAAIARFVEPRPDMTILDVGAGTGAFTAAFREWFGVTVKAVEPSPAMRERIPAGPGVEVLDGDAENLPVPDESADAAWLSTVTHHIPDLDAAAREIRRALKPGAPVLIRNVFPGRVEVASARFFPEITRMVDTYPSVDRTRAAFEAAGFGFEALEPVAQTDGSTLAGMAGLADRFRAADTLMRALTDEEFARGMERLRAAVAVAGDEPVVSYLDLLVVR